MLAAGRARFERRTVGEVRSGTHAFPSSPRPSDRPTPARPQSAFSAACTGLSASARNSSSTTCARCCAASNGTTCSCEQLRSIRLVFMPIVNPGGMWARTRSNPNGVDLMRNAPQSAEGRVPFLAGGQRIGAVAAVVSRQPRRIDGTGKRGAPLGRRGRTDVAAVQLRARLPFGLRLGRQHLVSLRPHRRARWPHLAEMFLLKTMFEQSCPHHGYAFEPQSHQYLLHGDLWDCAYDRRARPTSSCR